MSLVLCTHGEDILKKYEDTGYRKNWIKYPKNKIIPIYPLALDIEVTNKCNLKCEMCRTTHNEFSNTLMDINTYTKIIDSIKNLQVFSIKFNWRGEPTLHPLLCSMIRLAKEAEVIDTYFNTNGQLLTEELIKELFKSGLDRISISIDTNNPVFYEFMRKGAKWSTLINNIYMLKKLRDELHPDFKIRIQAVNNKDLNISSYIDTFKKYCDQILVLEMKEEVKYENNEGYIDNDFWCEQLSQRLVIDCDGNILPCNEDYNCNMKIGNVNDNHNCNIVQAWLSNTINHIRDIHMDGKSHLLYSCNRCPLRKLEIQKGVKS